MKGIVLTVGFLFVLFSGTAEARRHKHPVQAEPCLFMCDNVYAFGGPVSSEGRKNRRYIVSPRYHFGGEGKPRRWCGWYMQRKTGVTSKVTGRNLNMAREWAHVGTPASPAPGVIVVWRHHVGQIVEKVSNGWMIHSGNDGNAVRTRVRSIAGAIAFRSI